MYRKLTRFAISGLLTLGTCEYCIAQTAWRWERTTTPEARDSVSTARPKPATTVGSPEVIGPIGQLDWHRLPPTSSSGSATPAPSTSGNDILGSQGANQPPMGSQFRFPQTARPTAEAVEVRSVAWDALPLKGPLVLD